jgi:hypothetical protein
MSQNELNPDPLKAVTQVNDEYLRADSILFQDDFAKKGHIFKAADRLEAKRKKARACIVPEFVTRSLALPVLM